MLDSLKAIGRDVGISLVVPQVNSLGVALLGGQPLDEILDDVICRASGCTGDCRNDLYRRAPIDKVDAALAAAKTLIVLDHQRTETALRAHVLLAAASFAEGDGLSSVREGRAQRYFRCTTRPGMTIRSRLRRLALAACAGDRPPWRQGGMDASR